MIDEVEREIKMCERVPRDIKAILREIFKNWNDEPNFVENYYWMMLNRKFIEN